MEDQIIKISEDITSIADSTNQIQSYIKIILQRHWWDTQWFSSLFGVILGTIITLSIGWMKDYLQWRKKILLSWYKKLIKGPNLDDLIYQALHISYAYGGKDTNDKSLSEKVLIEFRKKYKHWNLPLLSRLRFLFIKCEKFIKKLPNKNNAQYEEFKKSDEKEFKKIFDEIE